MKIPASFRKCLERAFYDKEVSVCVPNTETDEFGAVVVDGFSISVTTKASVQPASSVVMVEEFGQTLDATKRIACNLVKDQVNETSNVILIEGVYHDIRGVLPTDTSLIIMVKERTM